ncbi:MAG TPA: hypothetical protein VHS06_09140 [Chloroflexota bacterium]|nr:hypothetical protein [Chloroflexota bacterium]
MRDSAVLALLLLAMLVVVGCGESAHATGVNDGPSVGQTDITRSTGEPSAVGPQYPDALKKFPVPQGFALGKGGHATVMQRGDLVAVATWKGSGSISGVVEYYRQSLPKQGWGENVTFSSDQSAQFTYTKDLCQATTLVEKDGNDIVISVAIGRTSEDIPTPVPTATPVPTPTRVPTATPKGAVGRNVPPTVVPLATFTPQPLSRGDASTVPAELKDVPVPGGFTLVDGSARRVAQGGVLGMAAADWFGKSSPKEIGAYYRSALAKGWNDDSFVESANEVNAQYTSKKDARLTLLIEVSLFESDTVIHMSLVRSQ